jgi:hypothetical protein
MESLTAVANSFRRLTYAFYPQSLEAVKLFWRDALMPVLAAAIFPRPRPAVTDSETFLETPD